MPPACQHAWSLSESTAGILGCETISLVLLLPTHKHEHYQHIFAFPRSSSKECSLFLFLKSPWASIKQGLVRFFRPWLNCNFPLDGTALIRKYIRSSHSVSFDHNLLCQATLLFPPYLLDYTNVYHFTRTLTTSYLVLYRSLNKLMASQLLRLYVTDSNSSHDACLMLFLSFTRHWKGSPVTHFHLKKPFINDIYISLFWISFQKWTRFCDNSISLSNSNSFVWLLF